MKTLILDVKKVLSDGEAGEDRIEIVKAMLAGLIAAEDDTEIVIINQGVWDDEDEPESWP